MASIGPQLEQIFYLSRSLIGTDPQAFIALVTQARVRNQILDVTGVLAFTGTHFAQIVEGETQTVRELMEIIKRDPRHEDVCILYRLPRQRRQYARWSMGYIYEFGVGECIEKALDVSESKRVGGEALARQIFANADIM